MELSKEIVSLYHSPIITISANNQEDIKAVLLEELLSVGNYKSKKELRRLFWQGAVSVNNLRVLDLNDLVLNMGDNVIQIGKGRFFLVKLNED